MADSSKYNIWWDSLPIYDTASPSRWLFSNMYFSIPPSQITEEQIEFIFINEHSLWD